MGSTATGCATSAITCKTRGSHLVLHAPGMPSLTVVRPHGPHAPSSGSSLRVLHTIRAVRAW